MGQRRPHFILELIQNHRADTQIIFFKMGNIGHSESWPALLAHGSQNGAKIPAASSAHRAVLTLQALVI